MKQDAISYLSTEQEELDKLCEDIFSLSEESYKEYQTTNCICDFLEKRNFKIERNFLDIETSFKATIGEGHPIICFPCEYDAVENTGHLTGHNLNTKIQISAAIGLAHILPKMKTEGTIILLGCPGEYLGGSKETMLRQNVFDEFDAVLSVQANTKTCETKTSAAVIPLNLTFKSKYQMSLNTDPVYTSLDATLMLCNILKTLEKGIRFNKSYVDYTICESTKNPYIKANDSRIKLLIRSKSMDDAKLLEYKIKSISEYISTLLDIDFELHLYQPPSEPLVSNSTLSRMLSHNLKESGIIDINYPTRIFEALSIGGVSTKIPTINYLISIVGDDLLIKYGTENFAKATLTPLAIETARRASCALLCTAIDLIEAPHLLIEAKLELHNLQNEEVTNLY